MKKGIVVYSLLVVSLMFLSGCATNKELVASLQVENDRLRTHIMAYEENLEDLASSESSLQNLAQGTQDEINALNAKIVDLESKLLQKEEEQSSILKTKLDLEKQLESEISKYQAKLEMTEKGLVVSFLAEILFDSGKAEVKSEGFQVLGKVTHTLKDNAIDNQIAIEGHTDNVPIKYSGWKSNWELSSARALSVLHNFIDESGITPEQLSAVAYGEHSPRFSNETEEGRKQNRRVEILIIPNLKRATVQENE